MKRIVGTKRLLICALLVAVLACAGFASLALAGGQDAWAFKAQEIASSAAFSLYSATGNAINLLSGGAINLTAGGTNQNITLTPGLTGSTITPSPNGIIFANDFAGATVTNKLDAAISSCGSSPCLVVVPSTMGAGAPTTIPFNVTLWDFRGGLPTGSFDFNSVTALNTQARLRIAQSPSSPSGSTVTLYALNLPGGTLPSGQANDGISGECNPTGSLTTPGTTSCFGGEFGSNVSSTGGNLTVAGGLVVSGNVLSGSTTTVAEFDGLLVQPVVTNGPLTVTDSYGIHIESPSAGTRYNYPLLLDGSEVFANAAGIAVKDASGVPTQIENFYPGIVQINGAPAAGVQQRFIGSPGSGQYNFLIGSDYNVGNALEITPSTTTDGSTFTSPAVVIVQTGRVGIGTASPQATLDVAGQDRREPVTFSTLTACSATIEGETAAITDSTTNTWGATITGGGADHVLGYCDGTNWTVAAK